MTKRLIDSYQTVNLLISNFTKKCVCNAKTIMKKLCKYLINDYIVKVKSIF